MVLEYFTRKQQKQPQKEENDAVKSPVLTDEDENFLTKITSDVPEPPVSEQPTVILDNGAKVKGKDAQAALMDGAEKIPLPVSPPVDERGNPVEEQGNESQAPKPRNYWAYIPNIPNLNFKNRLKERAGNDLTAAAETFKAGGVEAQNEAEAETAEEQKKVEERELTSILDRLNLSAINNRAFSFSKESEKLMDEFTQILKDMVNGVPTAYDDLEKLLTRSDKQIRGMYSNMPPFLQTLVKSLPAKLSTTIAPELLAAASEKPGADAKRMGIDTDTRKSSSGQAKKKKRGVPSLRTVVKNEGAVAGMLKSIVNFLKLRFPAFITGTNVIMSLAVFLLLFVFWYCHKRGREVRLDKERLAAETASTAASDAESTAEDTESDTAEQPMSASQEKDLEAVLNQPAPKEVPLPENPAEEGK